MQKPYTFACVSPGEYIGFQYNESIVEEREDSIMKIYVRVDRHGMPPNHNFYTAQDGFRRLGQEIITFQDISEVPVEKDNLIISFVADITDRVKALGGSYSIEDYPEELKDFLGRSVWEATIQMVSTKQVKWPVFVKPKEEKLFGGRVVRSRQDLIGCVDSDGRDVPVYCSEPVDIVTEWRCFVRNGRIMDVRHYRGDWRQPMDPDVIQNAVKAYTSAPRGYALDFGRTKDGRFIVIEANDGYSLGHYGLYPTDYAKLLAARWSEMVGIEDEFNF